MATKQTTKIRRRKAGRMIPTTDNPGAIAVTDAAGARRSAVNSSAVYDQSAGRRCSTRSNKSNGDRHDRSHQLRAVILMPQQSTIAGFAFDPQTTQLLWRSIDKEVARLIREQGLRAFEMRGRAPSPMRQAMWSLQRTTEWSWPTPIFRRIVERRAAWTGFTKSAQPYQLELMLTDPATDPPRNIVATDMQSDRRRRRRADTRSGRISRGFVARRDYRFPSACGVVDPSPRISAREPEDVVGRSWRRTAMVIHGNQKLACAIMTNLDAFGIVRRKQIAKLTNNRRLSNDPLDGIIKDGST